MADTRDTFLPPGLQGLRSSLLSTDVMLATGVAVMLLALILPVPWWILDIGLALSITFSVIILMLALFIRRPLELSAFPTILLVSTMLRLTLNMASTRLILGHGHEGPDAAGDIIAAFGDFVMQGNFVIGVIVFTILMTINFVVITKGSGRIAEVAARFTLDAMPGKQMAVDADLSSGLITEEQARQRRRQLEDESAFFGAMDGASKFVRGDAVAGLVIILVNIIGGLVVGVGQNDLGVSEALGIYTNLTVGDGLVSQIPALIVSTAAGLMVSKTGGDHSLGDALFRQLGAYPRALATGSGLTAALSLLPGIPVMPFLVLSAATGCGSWYLFRQQQREQELAATAAREQETQHAEEPVSTALTIDAIRLELGYQLLSLINSSRGFRLTDQIRVLRRELAEEMGFVMPSVRILDNVQLPGSGYIIRIKEVEAGRGEVRPGLFLAISPDGGPLALPGEKTTEPTFGLPAVWVDSSQRDEAQFRGLTVVDPATVITTHLTEVIREHMADLLSYSETQKLVDQVRELHPKLVSDLVPSQITIGALQRVLQEALLERVSIRDLPTILEALAEGLGYTRNSSQLTEHVRMRLARQISHAHTLPEGHIPIVVLSPAWEQTFSEALVGKGDERQLAMSPKDLQDFIVAVRETFDRLAQEGHMPVLLVSPAIRPYVRSVVGRFRSSIPVLSQSEIHPRARLRTLGQI